MVYEIGAIKTDGFKSNEKDSLQAWSAIQNTNAYASAVSNPFLKSMLLTRYEAALSKGDTKMVDLLGKALTSVKSQETSNRKFDSNNLFAD